MKSSLSTHISTSFIIFIPLLYPSYVPLNGVTPTQTLIFLRLPQKFVRFGGTRSSSRIEGGVSASLETTVYLFVYKGIKPRGS